MISLIVIGLPICAAFGASAIALAQERNAPSFKQLLGAGFLIMVVLAHVAERFDFFPSMGWGLPESTGHYVDLVSMVAGLILLPAGYLLRKRTSPRAGEPSKVTHTSTPGRGVDDAAPQVEQRRALAKRYEEASGVEMMGPQCEAFRWRSHREIVVSVRKHAARWNCSPVIRRAPPKR